MASETLADPNQHGPVNPCPQCGGHGRPLRTITGANIPGVQVDLECDTCHHLWAVTEAHTKDEAT